MPETHERTCERTYKISEFAAMTGMTPSKVRFYDKAGLFASRERDESGYRTFTPHDAFRANAFRVLLQYGFTVEAAIDMLDARQGSSEFEASLRVQLGALEREADLLRYRLRRIQSALDMLEMGHDLSLTSAESLPDEGPLPPHAGERFELVDVDDQLYVNASHGYDFSVSIENREEIALFYELLSITSCARVISREDLQGDSETIDPSYVISMPAQEGWRLDNCDPSHIKRLEMGKCLRYHRQLTRQESLRKQSFDPLFSYLGRHGYRLRGDVLLLPGFMNLDGWGADVETLLVPIE